MTDVSVTVSDGKVAVQTPYNIVFPEKARKLGGEWNAAQKVWTFDGRDEARVRALCRQVYGTDGSATDELVSVRVCIEKAKAAGIVTTDSSWRATQAFAFGRPLARVHGRDSGARLEAGVILLEGDLWSGGSRKNPGLQWDDKTVILVRDVPRAIVEATVCEGVQIEPEG